MSGRQFSLSYRNAIITGGLASVLSCVFCKHLFWSAFRPDFREQENEIVVISKRNRSIFMLNNYRRRFTHLGTWKHKNWTAKIHFLF